MAEYILDNINISTLSVYDLLKHTSDSAFIGIRDFREIYPVAIENNTGIFTKQSSLQDFPVVSISKINSSLLCSCTCDHEKQLCTHQAEIIHCIIEDKNYRLFLMKRYARKIFLPKPEDMVWKTSRIWISILNWNTKMAKFRYYPKSRKYFL